MVRTQVYTGLNTFFHIEDNFDNAIIQRKAMLYINDVAVLLSPLISFKVNNQFKFKLNNILAEIANDIQVPDLENIRNFKIEALPELIKTLKIVVSNKDNSNQIETSYTILFGKIPAEEFFSLQQDTLQVNFQNALTCRDETQYVSDSQPIFINTIVGFVLSNETSITLKVIAEYFFYDGSLVRSDISTLHEVANNMVYRFGSTVKDLKEHIPDDFQTRNLLSVSLSFHTVIDSESLQISPDMVFVINPAYYPDERIVIYQNQLGVYESLSFKGQITKEKETSTETIMNDGMQKNVSISSRKKISLQLSPEEHDVQAIVDDIDASKNIYLVLGGKLMPLIRDFKSLKSFDSQTINDAPVFDFKYPFEY